MSTRKHTTETRQKISDGVKRHYANMSVEENELRKKRISNYRQRENKVFKFCKTHHDFIKRVLAEIKAEQAQGNEE